MSEVSLVSHRFHQLVTTPHAWRIAFSRFFPGAEALNNLDVSYEASGDDDRLYEERRIFTRLTALASWRSEYILRTRLLRSLSRGKPAEGTGSINAGSHRTGSSNGGSAHVTYNSDLITIVDHLHATFGTGLNKKLPRFIHGATDVGMASSSDPRLGKVDSWGFADAFGAQNFSDVYPGDALYGLGPGNIVGAPNSMDVSQPYGVVYVEGLPGGRAYYRSTDEKRGRNLTLPLGQSILELGVPSVVPTEALTSAWIAKSPIIPDLSEGMVGMLVGSSQGIISAYSLGTNPLRERRLERGELIARWVLSPGVPIIAIAVDDNYSVKRQSTQRPWAIALNALGEVFCLNSFPVRRSLDRAMKLDEARLEVLAWETGRTVHWTLVKPSIRTARPDPFNESELDSSHTPRSSWNGMALTVEQIVAETKDVNTYLQKKPEYFRNICEGWDMRRRLEVDFSSSDDNGAGEGIFVISCAMDDEKQQPGIKRYTRCMIKEPSDEQHNSLIPHAQQSSMIADVEPKISPSDLGNNAPIMRDEPSWSFGDAATTRRNSATESETASSIDMVDEWRTSVFTFGGLKPPQITTTAIDCSNLSVLMTTEDPLLCMNGTLPGFSPASSPLGQMPPPNSPRDVPGQRARFLAVGTNTGTIILWNMRALTPDKIELETHIKPVRIIHTDSPQISCLALTALYLVHGGNDGLVQAWDPLASTTSPIRTLNSRFSSRARRRLVQAEASPAGVGINLFAAGAICLDPDPTVLRGMVSLGSHLRYWTYSSQAADSYKGSKRRLRRSERGSNQGGDRFSGTGRGALKDYIANEKLELEREKRIKRKEDDKLSSRFGVDLLGPGATEDEILAYATLLSEETARDDELRRKSMSETSSNETITEEVVASPTSSVRDDIDDDMAEAIRLSLGENNGFRASSLGDGDASASSFTVRYAKSKRSSPSRSPPRSSPSSVSKKLSKSEIAPEAELDDLEFALRLSQVEEESRAEKENVVGKGKGRAS